MRIQRALLPFSAIVYLASCAGTPPEPPASVATWNGGSLSVNRWENWKTTSGAPAVTTKDQEKLFQDYTRYALDARAAEDLGLKSDSAKAKRWASIELRIVGDMLNRVFIGTQGGATDSAILHWASTQPPEIQALPIDSLRIRGGRELLVAGANLDSIYNANKSLFRKDSATYQPIDSVRSKLKDLAFQSRVGALSRDLVPNLRTKYGVKVLEPKRPPVPVDSLRAFWKQNADRWSGQAIYHFSALGSKDSASLAKDLTGAKTLDAFRTLSAKFPVGTPVAPLGALGRVKRNYALPYGLGMVPDAFNAIDKIKPGTATSVFKAKDSLYIALWFEGLDSAKITPFDSIRGTVEEAYNQQIAWVPPAQTVFATWDKGNLFTEKDIEFIAEEIPAHMRRQFPNSRVLDFMISWEVSGRYARSIGFTDRPNVKAVTEDNAQIFWAQEFRNSPTAQMFYFPRSEADKATDSWKPKFGNTWRVDSSAGANRDGARLLLLKAGEIEAAYQVGIDNFRRDSVLLPLDSVRLRIYQDKRPALETRGRERIDSIQKAKFEFKVLPGAPVSVKLPSATALDSGRAFHDRRSLEEAEALYRQVESDATALDSLRAQALFQLGQLYGEQQQYPKSLEAYRSVLVRFPGSSDAYKAQFMIAFTQSEYLKNEKVALAEYRKMLANYPKSDLAADADWMIRNIESGGALMPKFDDSSFVADSIAKADSAKKSANPPKSGASTTPAKPAAPIASTPAPTAPVKVAAPVSAAKPATAATTPAVKPAVPATAPAAGKAPAPVAPKAAAKPDSSKSKGKSAP